MSKSKFSKRTFPRSFTTQRPAGRQYIRTPFERGSTRIESQPPARLIHNLPVPGTTRSSIPSSSVIQKLPDYTRRKKRENLVEIYPERDPNFPGFQPSCEYDPINAEEAYSELIPRCCALCVGNGEQCKNRARLPKNNPHFCKIHFQRCYYVDGLYQIKLDMYNPILEQLYKKAHVFDNYKPYGQEKIHASSRWGRRSIGQRRTTYGSVDMGPCDYQSERSSSSINKNPMILGHQRQKT